LCHKKITEAIPKKYPDYILCVSGRVGDFDEFREGNGPYLVHI